MLSGRGAEEKRTSLNIIGQTMDISVLAEVVNSRPFRINFLLVDQQPIESFLSNSLQRAERVWGLARWTQWPIFQRAEGFLSSVLLYCWMPSMDRMPTNGHSVIFTVWNRPVLYKLNAQYTLWFRYIHLNLAMQQPINSNATPRPDPPFRTIRQLYVVRNLVLSTAAE